MLFLQRAHSRIAEPEHIEAMAAASRSNIELILTPDGMRRTSVACRAAAGIRCVQSWPYWIFCAAGILGGSSSWLDCSCLLWSLSIPAWLWLPIQATNESWCGDFWRQHLYLPCQLFSDPSVDIGVDIGEECDGKHCSSWHSCQGIQMWRRTGHWVTYL